MMTSKNIDSDVMTLIHGAIFDYLVFIELQLLYKPDCGKIQHKLPIFILINLLPSKTESKSGKFNPFQVITPFLDPLCCFQGV